MNTPFATTLWTPWSEAPLYSTPLHLLRALTVVGQVSRATPMVLADARVLKALSAYDEREIRTIYYRSKKFGRHRKQDHGKHLRQTTMDRMCNSDVTKAEHRRRDSRVLMTKV
jgi:hypothetical protein